MPQTITKKIFKNSSKAQSPKAQFAHEDSVYKNFLELLGKWDKEKLSTQAEVKFLLLDNAENPLKLLSYSEQDLRNPEKIFREAENSDAKYIVIGENDPNDEIFLTENSQNIFQKFKEASKGFNVKLKDYIKFSPWGYNSSLENKLI